MTFFSVWFVPFAVRFCLVVMFPLSGYDKIAHWDEAMGQARGGPVPAPALMLIAAIAIEIVTPICIVIGWHDRLAAFVLAGFCVVTALLYHPFWNFPDFWSKNGEGRSHLWDFLKNFGLVGGLMLVVIGGAPVSAVQVARHPLSAMPYAAQPLTPAAPQPLNK
ncbi:MAG: DoxX family protein [Rhodospirillales bacterium 20-64-7]|nr:MAG: DoxX family protein [Rhodospirillales bacterium 20-64-7]